MYEDFRVRDRWTGEEIHCVYQALIVAIATRHADAVDIKFLANGKPIWIALPHPAWVEYQRRTGKVITDPLAIQIAGHYLKTAIESGADASVSSSVRVYISRLASAPLSMAVFR